MRQLFVLFAFLAASAAHATTVKIATLDGLYGYPGSVVTDISLYDYKFEVNPDNGRARINVTYLATYVGGYDDSGAGPGNNQVMVQGLSFDAERSEVLYKNAEGKVTSCATVKITGGIFGRVKVKNTGLCTLTGEQADLVTDDGWETRRTRVLNAFLNVQD